MKYNAWCDASYEPNRTTVGVVIKDKNNNIVESYSKRIIGCESSFEAECYGLLILLRTVYQKGLKQVKIHTDCKTVVELLRKYFIKNKCKEKHENIVSEIIDMLDEIGLHIFNIVWVSRENNWEAHYLSRRKTNECIKIKNGNDIALPYIVSQNAIKNYKNHCKSSSRNTDCDGIALKINRAACLGEKVYEGKDKNGNAVKTIKYWNLTLKIRGNEIIGIRRSNNDLVKVAERTKKKWSREMFSFAEVQ